MGLLLHKIRVCLTVCFFQILQSITPITVPANDLWWSEFSLLPPRLLYMSVHLTYPMNHQLTDVHSARYPWSLYQCRAWSTVSMRELVLCRRGRIVHPIIYGLGWHTAFHALIANSTIVQHVLKLVIILLFLNDYSSYYQCIQIVIRCILAIFWYSYRFSLCLHPAALISRYLLRD